MIHCFDTRLFAILSYETFWPFQMFSNWNVLIHCSLLVSSVFCLRPKFYWRNQVMVLHHSCYCPVSLFFLLKIFLKLPLTLKIYVNMAIVESSPFLWQVIPCAVLSILIHPNTSHAYVSRILWAFCVYLESVSVLPQLRLIQNAKVNVD